MIRSATHVKKDLDKAVWFLRCLFDIRPSGNDTAAAMAVFIVLLSGGCGGDGRGPGPTPPITPSPTVTSMAISGDTGFAALNQTSRLSATAKLSNGSTQDITNQAAWRSSNLLVAAVATSGSVTARGSGAADIFVDYQGANARTSVFVIPISAQASRYVREFNQAVYRGNTRWMASPIVVWADPGFRRVDLQAAIGLWQTALPGLIQFAVGESRATAHIVFEFNPSTPVGCGQESPRDIKDFVITSGYGEYSPRRECTGAGSAAMTALANGLGHIMGFTGQTPDNVDVMSAPNVPFRMSGDLADAMKWIYSVPPGTKLVQ